MRITYKFDNDEKKIDINMKEYLVPKTVEIFFREGDAIYVDTGDFASVNQLLSETSTGIKNYSSVSGVVERKNDSLVITNDFKDASINSDTYVDDIGDIKKDELFDICQKLGLSYDNKLIVDKFKANNKILVVNCMDIEPYQFNSNYLFQDNVKNLLDTIDFLSKRLNLDAYLFLSKYDDNNVYAVKTLISKYPHLNFIIFNDVFPYNNNALLAKKYFREYKFDEILFLDTVILYKIFVALKEKQSVFDKYITVVFDDTSKAYVIKTKYGANLKEVLENSISENFADKDIFLNNFMRKTKCPNIDGITITDNIKSIFIFEKDDSIPTKCIKCGKCVDICPVGINPLRKKLDSACIRCGLCNYVCPANRNLISREKEI